MSPQPSIDRVQQDQKSRKDFTCTLVEGKCFSGSLLFVGSAESEFGQLQARRLAGSQSADPRRRPQVTSPQADPTAQRFVPAVQVQNRTWAELDCKSRSTGLCASRGRCGRYYEYVPNKKLGRGQRANRTSWQGWFHSVVPHKENRRSPSTASVYTS